jgi:hypothetical protein
MRTTLNLNAELLEKAMRLTGIKEKTAVVQAGLESLIARESARRLAALGGTMPKMRPIPTKAVTGRQVRVLKKAFSPLVAARNRGYAESVAYRAATAGSRSSAFYRV